jgi:hypothetical protein
MANRPYIDVRFITLKLLFGHALTLNIAMRFAQDLTRVACGEARSLKN